MNWYDLGHLVMNDMIEKIAADKNIYYVPELPLFTVYDDNLFVRNDYDILSRGQRNYVINFFKQFGFKQTSGKLVTDGKTKIHFPKPQRVLALTAHQPQFNDLSHGEFYAVTPSTFAEAIFHASLCKEEGESIDWLIEQLHALINKCPYNIELTRDINYRSPIETITKETFKQLMDYQAEVIERKFKFKKTL